MIRELTAYIVIKPDHAKLLKQDQDFLDHIQALLAEKLVISLAEFAELQTVETAEGLGVFARVFISNDELVETASVAPIPRVCH